jgi:8-amino-7-oxononanoate synthase
MDIDAKLEQIKEKGLNRSLFELPASGGKFHIDGKEYINFSSNDYLDLSSDSRVKAAAADAAEKYGAGAGGSRLMCGTFPVHRELEESLSDFFGYGAALVFGSGFLANAGVISALAGPGDTVFIDRLCHASLIDGVRLSGAKWKRFAHNDTAGLEEMLRNTGTGEKFIVADSVFSMDGDICPVEELKSLSEKYNVFLIIDEAHAVGVFGVGRGICASKKIMPDIMTGTLSKALGGYGGFAACGEKIRQLLINSARSFIFSTALPPASAGAGIMALGILKNEPGLGPALLENAAYFHSLLKKSGLSVPEFSSQIIPVIIGDNEKAVAAAEAIQKQGIYARAIRPPTVPKGTARIRLSVTLAHTRADLENAAIKIAGAVCGNA